MKVLYRSAGGGLADSMKNVKLFSSVETLLDYLVCKYGGAFSKTDIVFEYYCYDSRINWHTYLVSVKRYFTDDYIKEFGCPYAIGFCTFCP